MGSVGVQDPTLMSLVKRDTRSGAEKVGAKVGAGLAKAFGGGSKKQAQYGKAVSTLAGKAQTKYFPKVQAYAAKKGKELLSAGIAKARSYVGLKKGGRACVRMCKGGMVGKKPKRKVTMFKTKSGKEVKFATGGKVRHAPGRF